MTDDAFNGTFLRASSGSLSRSRLLTCSLLVLSHCYPACSATKQASPHAVATSAGAACFVPTDSRFRQGRKRDVLLGRSNSKIRSSRRDTCRFSQASSISTDDPTSSSSSANAATASLDIGSMSQQVDRILTSVLINAAGENPLKFGLDEITQSLHGMRVWGEVLRKGRLPAVDEFDVMLIWPEEPLYTQLVNVMTELELPRFVLRHPETTNAVLLSILRMVIQFNQRAGDDDGSDSLADTPEEEEDSEDDEESPFFRYKTENTDSIETMAVDLADELAVQWGGIVNAMSSLDQLFGLDHGLLDPALILEDDVDVDDLEDENDSTASAPFGFGLNDGIWTHSGWEVMPALQARLSKMPELRHLISSLGKRPSAEGKEVQKFPPQVRSSRSALGVEVDPLSRDSVRGITRTSSLTEMLPSEAALLKGSPALRRLFLAKKVEGKLLGYDISGYADVPSRPKKRRSSYMKRLPSAPGGPIIVCLDTSFSMTGDREILSKAVVLECVKIAHKQQRDCTVVAFSSESNTLECDLLAADKGGLAKLLNFLQHSFSGGTDVTGALRFAMDALGTDAMKSADILLVSDGELQNPPVSDEVMEKLNCLKLESSMEIHGLLIGKTESEPLEALCSKDKVYDFLAKYDALGQVIGTRPID